MSAGHTFKNRFVLEIRDLQYGFPVGLVRGHLVTHGDEVDFYNEDLCNLPFPQGVGRYSWTVKGERLRLARIDSDPCATRRGVLEDATYRRLRWPSSSAGDDHASESPMPLFAGRGPLRALIEPEPGLVGVLVVNRRSRRTG